MSQQISKMKRVGGVLKNTGSEFAADDCMGNGAAIAYYTIFSLPPLLAIVFALTTQFWSEQTVTRVMKSQLGLPLPEQQTAAATGESVELTSVAKRAQSERAKGHTPWAKWLGIGLLVFSASGVLAKLQMALNKAWNVEPDPQAGGIKAFLVKRALSMGMVIVIGLLLLISLVVTTLVDEFTSWLQLEHFPSISMALMIVLNNLIAVSLATLLFAAALKILPDAKVEWRDVWIGAFVTAVLFVIGKSLIGWYLQYSHAGSSWGSAAASLVGILVWVYFSSLIILLGAEFTQNWALEFGSGLHPESGAVLASERKTYHSSEDEMRKERDKRSEASAAT